tara:strand:+ start:1200 stop:1640 length:441 start_codon:yes stop_codon:yes gene_type:complete
MKVQGTYKFEAPIEKIWGALQSPEVLSNCIPGCEKFDPEGENTYLLAIKVKVASVTGKYTGKVSIKDISFPDQYTMEVEGKGSGGTVKATGVLHFSESNGVTTVNVEGEARVSGIVARVGQRIIGGASKMLMNQFFGCLTDKVGKT